MTNPMWWIVGIYLAIATALLIRNQRPRAYEGAVLRFQNAVGVELPQGLGERLRKRLLVNRRSGLIGGMVGVVVSALIISSRTDDPGAFEAMILAAGAFAGTALAVSVTTLFAPRQPADDRLRFARPQAVGMRDYVPATERWLARGPAVVAGLYFAVWGVGSWWSLLSPPDGAALVGGSLLALLAIGSLVIFEVAGRRIVSMGNRVASEEELVWEDAIRSQTVRDISAAPALVGLYAIVSAVPVLFGEDSVLLGWTGVIASMGVVALLLVTIALKPERHFLRRLWPELAATTGKPYGADATSSPSGTED